MNPHVHFCESLEEYLNQAAPIFNNREVEHSVMLGATSYLKQDINFFNVTPELIVVKASPEVDAPVVFAAQMVHPWPLALSLPNPDIDISPEVLESCIKAFIAQAFPGFRERRVFPVKLLGPTNSAILLHDAMDDKDKSNFERGKDIQFYHVTPTTLADPRLPMKSSGMVARRYDENKDDVFVVPWLRQFQIDCFGACNESVLEKQMADYKALPHHLRGLFILFDGDHQPVSLAGYGGPTERTMRISNVFTPQEHRGKGYGQLICWFVTNWLMTPPEGDDSHTDQRGLGCRSVAIAADLDNPTAVKIYTDIGFAPCVACVEFEDAAGVAAANVGKKKS